MRKPRRKSRPNAEGRRSPSPYSLKCSPTRETLTYAQAQRIVEVDIDGRTMLVTKNCLQASSIGDGLVGWGNVRGVSRRTSLC